jgi:hypothetical protein
MHDGASMGCNTITLFLLLSPMWLIGLSLSNYQVMNSNIYGSSGLLNQFSVHQRITRNIQESFDFFYLLNCHSCSTQLHISL